MYKDIEIVYDIFANKSWESVYHFKNEVSKIEDKKLAIGLLVEFIRSDFDYDISYDNVIDIMSDVLDGDDMCFVEASEYYINLIRDDVRTILLDFLQEGDEITHNINLINWVKSLSKNEVQILESYLVEKEMYEIIIFINDKRR